MKEIIDKLEDKFFLFDDYSSENIQPGEFPLIPSFIEEFEELRFETHLILLRMSNVAKVYERNSGRI